MESRNPEQPPANSSVAGQGFTWGMYRWSCLTLAGMCDDLGLSGEAQYLESLVAGVDENDPTLIPCPVSMAEEQDRYWRKVLSLLTVRQAEDQRSLWQIQARMSKRIQKMRVAGSYHLGCDDGRVPFGRG